MSGGACDGMTCFVSLLFVVIPSSLSPYKDARMCLMVVG